MSTLGLIKDEFYKACTTIVYINIRYICNEIDLIQFIIFFCINVSIIILMIDTFII